MRAIYISSTYLDLQAHGEAVYRQLYRMRHAPGGWGGKSGVGLVRAEGHFRFRTRWLMLSSLIAQRTDEATSSFSQVSEQICIVGAILSRRRRSGLFNV